MMIGNNIYLNDLLTSTVFKKFFTLFYRENKPFRKMGIPKLIHHMWLQKGSIDLNEPPERYKSFVESFHKCNPNFQFVFWNKKKVRELFQQNEQLKPWRHFYFHTLKFHIEKCDFARYALLFVYGGLYVDLDFQCLKPLHKLLKG